MSDLGKGLARKLEHRESSFMSRVTSNRIGMMKHGQIGTPLHVNKIFELTCQVFHQYICLVLWKSKKQNFIALTRVEGGYVAATSCCAQLLLMKQPLDHYGLKLKSIQIFCDNISAINLSKIPLDTP